MYTGNDFQSEMIGSKKLLVHRFMACVKQLSYFMQYSVYEQASHYRLKRSTLQGASSLSTWAAEINDLLKVKISIGQLALFTFAT